MLNEKIVIPSLIFIFSKFYSWNTKEKTSAKPFSGEEQDFNKQMAGCEISILY